MRCKIVCTENFQQVEFVVDIENMEEISMWVSSVRQAIKDGTSDVEGGKKKGTPMPQKKENTSARNESEMPVTQGQRNYLRNLGVDQNKINSLTSFTEASELIESLSGTKLRKQL